METGNISESSLVGEGRSRKRVRERITRVTTGKARRIKRLGSFEKKLIIDEGTFLRRRFFCLVVLDGFFLEEVDLVGLVDLA